MFSISQKGILQLVKLQRAVLQARGIRYSISEEKGIVELLQYVQENREAAYDALYQLFVDELSLDEKIGLNLAKANNTVTTSNTVTISVLTDDVLPSASGVAMHFRGVKTQTIDELGKGSIMALDPNRRYEVVFRGELLPGFTLEGVKPSLSKLFSAEPEQIQSLFAGKRVVIKTGLDAEAAQKYQTILQKAGLYIEVNPLSAVVASSSTTNAKGKDELPLWTIMEVGSLIGEPQKMTPQEVQAPNFTLAEPGADLGELPRPGKPVQVSIAHLSVLPLP